MAVYDNDDKFIDVNLSHIAELIVNKKNISGNTLLFEAAKYDQIKIVRALLKVKGISVNERCENGNTAMHAAF